MRTLSIDVEDFDGNRFESDPVVVSVAIVWSDIFDGVAEV